VFAEALGADRRAGHEQERPPIAIIRRVERLSDVSDAWKENAEQSLAWARTPEHDLYHWRSNLPAFAELVPAAGRRTVDIGCGEGRIRSVAG
jgi:hypothetical protein